MRKIALLFALVYFCGASARGQSHYQMVRCTDLINRRTEALNNQQWATLIQYSRQFLTECSDTVDKQGRASALGDIGVGLLEQKQPEDAIPVLKRCVALDPDFAFCWERLGYASFHLGRISDAKAFFKRTIETGGFNEWNAAAIKNAKTLLSELEKSFPDTESAPGGPDNALTNHSFGTGFFVSNQGDILTNNHVVAGCRTLATRDGKPLRVVSRKAGSDLALLKADSAPASVAVLRTGPSPKLGDGVVAFGFPLPGLLSSEGNVSTGVLSATSGIQNDIRFVQITAPVQPGNSGGPLFDSSGHVIGVVEAKLDALKVARATGDVPQNVNFAVHWAEVRAFLDEAGIQYGKEPSQHDVSTRNIAATATQVSVAIDCTE